MRTIRFWCITAAIFLLTFVAFFHKTSEISLDLGEHLVFGREIIQNRILPTTNMFSYTYPSAPFVHHEFIPDILFYLFSQWWGINSLIIVTAIIVMLSFGLLFFYVRKTVTPVVLFAGSFVYLRILFERTYVRPEVFSYLFLSIFIVILLTFRKRFTRWVYLLIPLQFLWVNSHIYFIMGIFLISCAFGDLILTNAYHVRRNDLYAITGVLIASILMCFANPNGVVGALYPFTVFTNYGFSVAENNSIFVIESLSPGRIIYSILFLKIAIVSLCFSLFFSFKKEKFFVWIAAATFAFLSVSAIRNFPLFIFGTFVLFLESANTTVLFFVKKIHNKLYSLKQVLTIGSEFTLFILFLVFIPFVWTLQHGGLGTDDPAKKAVDFFIAHHISGPIFNNYGIGSYLVYRLYPKEKVFVDGRPEAYPKEFFQNTYIPMQNDPIIFQKQSNRYQFNSIIFDYPAEQTNVSRKFIADILRNTQWHMVYLDDTVVIFVSDAQKNRKLIAPYEISQQTYTLEKKNYSEYSLENLAYFFTIAGWDSKAQEAYQKILAINPNNCAALANMDMVLAQKHDSGAAILEARYQSVCQK